MKPRLASLLLLTAATAHADPQLTSWYTADSGRYARIYQDSSSESSGTASTTWSRGSGTQSSPTYAGVSEVLYSASWVYIRTTGLASYIMGPWYLDSAKSQNFPNFPSNTATIYRIPRTPVIPGAKTSTGLGSTGRAVNGVSIFDSRDAFSYVNASATDATPTNGLTGDGIWNRDGWANEGVTFDPALAHQAGNNYHYHAHPLGLRYQLGDHVDYNAATNTYIESASTVSKHSPIVAWAADGLPIYGPYGYSDPTNAASSVRRMVSGFTLRDGTNGTTAITVRQVLPLWAQRIQGKTTLTSTQYGPSVSTSYPLGHYIEDFDYRGDLGQTQTTGPTVGDFDLNEQNVRYCVTPEYPGGTWAYFTPINADGTPQFPYTTGRQYYGSPTGGGVTSITETVTTCWSGGPNKTDVLNTPSVGGSDVTISWSGIEGGSYTVQASTDLSTWTDVASGTLSGGDQGQTTDTGGAANSRRFYQITRAATLASFDSTGFDYGSSGSTGSTANAPGGTAARGTTVTVTVTLPTTPPQPPSNLIPTSVTLAGSISGTSISRPSQGTVIATFVIPANASTGAQNIVVTFSPNPTYTMSGALTIN